MTEYISREAALNFEAEIDADPAEIQAISRGMALYAEHIKALPAADVAPVVRCRDCRYYNTAGCCKGFGWCYRNGAGHGTSEDWYCADGERQEEEA